MKTASGPLTTLINSGAFGCWDIYTITLFGGGVIRFTNAHFAINFGGNTFPPDLRVDPEASKVLAHWKVGLDVDQWVVVVSPRLRDDIAGTATPDQIGNVPWLQAARSGALDQADVVVQRAYFNPGTPVAPWPVSGAVPVDALTIFRGSVAECDVATTCVALTLNDYRDLLTINLPRNFYQSGCRFTLFDAGCALAASSFSTSTSVGSGSSQVQVINSSLPAPHSGSSGTYALGRIVMTSGLNNTFSRTIQSWNGSTTLNLLNPFPFAVQVGDTFTLYPGCDKTYAACGLFSNQVNFGGFQFIPPPETAV